MNFFRRRQDNRRKKSRPEGRVANFFQGVVSLVFYCILNDAAGGDDEREVVNEPSAGTTSAHSSSTKPLTIDTLVDHRRTNHEPRPCLTSLSSSITHSPSVGRLQESKGDGKTIKPSEEKKKKKNWFSWFKKGSKKNKVTKEREIKNHDEPAKLAGISTISEPARLSESSFKILQLTASPGGARKAYTSRLCAQPVRNADQIHDDACSSFGSTIENVDLDSAARKLDNTSLGGDKYKMESFSLSDVSSFGASEMSDNDLSSSFTEVTSLSSGEISDCWGPSDGQLPPFMSSSITDSFTDDGQDHIQVSKTLMFEGTMSASSDASENDGISAGKHGLESKVIPSTCSSGSAATKVQGDALGTAADKEAPSSNDDANIPGNIDTSDSIHIEVPTVAPNAAADKEAPSASSYSAAILGYIDAPHSNDIEVPNDTANTVETSDSTDRFGEVPGGTITDVYSLIKRTLNLRSPEPTNPDTSGGHDNNKTAEPHHRSSMTAGLKETQCNDLDSEERIIKVPEHSTPSLHKLHTELAEHDVNVEVLLGLKAPTKSFESFAVQKFNRGEDPLDSGNDVFLKTGAVSSKTEKDQISCSFTAESEMAIDSGVGLSGDCISSRP